MIAKPRILGKKEKDFIECHFDLNWTEPRQVVERTWR